MSKYIIGTDEATEKIPAELMLEIENAIDNSKREFGITFDHLEYRDWGDNLTYLYFRMFKRVKDYSFEINGQADVEENTVGEFYGIRINLLTDSEKDYDFCYAYDLSGINNFLEYAETTEFDEYISEIRKNKQLIEDLASQNKNLRATIQEKITKE